MIMPSAFLAAGSVAVRPCPTAAMERNLQIQHHLARLGVEPMEPVGSVLSPASKCQRRLIQLPTQSISLPLRFLVPWEHVTHRLCFALVQCADTPLILPVCKAPISAL